MQTSTHSTDEDNLREFVRLNGAFHTLGAAEVRRVVAAIDFCSSFEEGYTDICNP